MTDVEAIIQLYKIFHNKNWFSYENNAFVFENFCHLLENLESHQKDLIIELAEKYKWITFKDYTSLLINAFNQVEEIKLRDIQRIILFPLHNPEDENATKSGNSVLYTIKGVDMISQLRHTIPKYNKIFFQSIESYTDLYKSSLNFNGHELIFLIDDFLGSGETLHATLFEIRKDKFINFNSLNILSVAAQYEAIDYALDNGLSIYTDCIDGKGISDNYDQQQAANKLDIMEQIEELIPQNKCKFGYNQSEALITLIRTPNNTFPIFWKKYKKNQIEYTPPFPRE